MTNEIYLNEIARRLKWKISSGDDYLWDNYGPDCRVMEFGKYDDSFQVYSVFDPTTLRVFEVSGNDKDSDNPWRWVDPEYEDAHLKAHLDRKIDPNKAWDDISYTNISRNEMLATLDSKG